MASNDISSKVKPFIRQAYLFTGVILSRIESFLKLLAQKIWAIKATLILVIGTLYSVYYLNTSSGYIAKEVHSFWDYFTNNKYSHENEKMESIYARASEVVERWEYLKGFDNPASMDERYVRENIEDLYSVLQSVDSTVFKNRQKVLYHYTFVEINTIYSALKKDTSYLDDIENHIHAIHELISSRENSTTDVTFYLEYRILHRLQHMEFNIAALRHLYSTNSETKAILNQALEEIGGCGELSWKSVTFKPFFEATGCSCEGMTICL